MLIVSRIIHVKVDRRLNVTNKFNYQRRLSSRLAIVMFRGTPCILAILLCRFSNSKLAVQSKVGMERLTQLGYSNVHRWCEPNCTERCKLYILISHLSAPKFINHSTSGIINICFICCVLVSSQ